MLVAQATYKAWRQIRRHNTNYTLVFGQCNPTGRDQSEIGIISMEIQLWSIEELLRVV